MTSDRRSRWSPTRSVRAIRWATAQVTKNERRGHQGDGRCGGGGGTAAAAGQWRRPPRCRHGIRIQRGALLSHGTQQRSWRHQQPASAEGRWTADQEEAVRTLQGPGRVGRLQGRRHAPQVHERSRARSGLGGCRATAPSTSGTWPSPSRRPVSWCCCRTPSGPPPSAREVAGAAVVAAATGVRRPRSPRP